MAFHKGESGNPSGRPAKSQDWKDAEKDVRAALTQMLRMTKTEWDEKIMSVNPTGAQFLANQYVRLHPDKAIEKFLPLSWSDDPKSGADLISDALIGKLEKYGEYHGTATA